MYQYSGNSCKNYEFLLKWQEIFANSKKLFWIEFQVFDVKLKLTMMMKLVMFLTINYTTNKPTKLSQQAIKAIANVMF